MKKILFLVAAIALTSAAYCQPFDSNGATKALFSVAKGHQVRFSKGNLQYQASTAVWRFASNQYECMGSKNKDISISNEGWIDLFGYGTSGWDGSGVLYTMPWHVGEEPEDYSGEDLGGTHEQADWGRHNAISNGGNKPGLWRTLTDAEWNYLLFTRRGNGEVKDGMTVYPNLSFTHATVCGTVGLIVFPDGYKHPSGLSKLKAVNGTNAQYSSNKIGSKMWQKMEEAGCVFLPAAGVRGGTTYSGASAGHYWTASYFDEGMVWNVLFNESEIGIALSSADRGLSVRLVMDKQ